MGIKLKVLSVKILIYTGRIHTGVGTPTLNIYMVLLVYEKPLCEIQRSTKIYIKMFFKSG